MCAMALFATLTLQLRAAAQAPLGPAPGEVPPLTPAATMKRLDLAVSVSSGYDFMSATDTRPDSLVDRRLSLDSASSYVNTTLAFTRSSRSADFSASGGGNIQHYTSISSLLPVNLYGGASGGKRLGTRTQLRMSGGGTYSPYYSFGEFLTPRSETVALPRPDMNVARLATTTGAASIGLSTSLTQRWTMNTGYNADLLTTSSSAYRTFTTGGYAGMGYRATKYSQVRFGYGYRRSQGGRDAFAFGIHNIDAGFSYGRPLSFSRRTTITANSGSALVTYPGGNSFTFVGNAALTHQLTQRTAVSMSYYRDVSMWAGATRPYVSDAVSSSLSGALTKDLGYVFGGSYSLGRSMTNINNGFSLASGSGSLRYRLTRYVPVFVEYFYYNYRFERSLGLQGDFPLLAQRQGLHAGLSYSWPVIGRRTP
jgi:hypothetical protein